MNQLFDASLRTSKIANESVSNGIPLTRVVGVKCTGLKKPSRPLTAFHIFSQLEKEYIMQGPDRELKQSALNAFLPRRYHNLDLPYDWCESPGKRRKRKHRKTGSSKSGVGFVEMSRMIAARWAELEEVDMETKVFVKNVAEQKLHEYHQDLIKYKATLKDKVKSSKKQKQVMTSILLPAQDQLAMDRSPHVDHSINGELDSSSNDPHGNSKHRSTASLVALSSPQPAQRAIVSPCSTLTDIANQWDSSQFTRDILTGRAELVSPSNSFGMDDEVPVEGSRYGEVDVEDDAIIEMFIQKEPEESDWRTEIDKFMNHSLSHTPVSP